MSKEIRFIYNRRRCRRALSTLSNQRIFDWLDDTIMKLYLEATYYASLIKIKSYILLLEYTLSC
jgi:hypothetical protein